MIAAATLDQLAAALHNGWLRYMSSLGYTVGDRDEKALQHPDLKPFVELELSSRVREREIATDALQYLLDIGYVSSSNAGGFPLSHLQTVTAAARVSLTDELALVVFRSWARSRPDLPFSSRAQTLTRDDWMELTSQSKRDQDRAAIHGFLQRLESLVTTATAPPVVRPRPSVGSLTRTAQPELPRTGLLNLERNEMVPPIESSVYAEIVASLGPESFSDYPAVGPLYDDLAKHLGVGVDQVIVGAGSDWLIRACFDAFCSSGDRVVVPIPTYGMYEVYAQMHGAEVARISYLPDFSFPLREVLDELEHGPRILALANPNGALGTVIARGDLDALFTAAHARGTLVILDEAYVDFAANTELPDLANYPHVVVIRTFSKAAGLAGLRVGYAVGSTEVIGWMKQVRPNVEVNQVGVAASRHLLANSSIIAGQVSRTTEGRDNLVHALRELGVEVRVGHANFLLVRLAHHHDAVLRALGAADILVKEHLDDGILAGWTRITAADATRMSLVANVIRSAINGG